MSDRDDRTSFDNWLDEPIPLPSGWTQARGRAFEKIIAEQMRVEGLAPRTSFRPTGEEIDGSFWMDGRPFLLEAKWHRAALPASALYSFKGKVDGKLVGTLGVFISMSDYSVDAIDALRYGKSVNVLLFARNDWVAIMKNEVTFAAALRTKMRFAGEEGQPFLPITSDDGTLIDSLRTQDAIRRDAAARAPIWNLIVEGNSDAAAIRVLLERIGSKAARSVRIWAAGGVLNTASLASNMRETRSERIAVLIDRDAIGVVESRAEEKTRLSSAADALIIVTPSLESWLMDFTPTDWFNAAPPALTRTRELQRLAAHVDVEAALNANNALSKWMRDELVM